MSFTTAQKIQIIKKHNDIVGMVMFMKKFEAESKQKMAELTEEFAKRLEAMREEMMETHQMMRKMQKGDTGSQGIQGERGDTGHQGESIVGPAGKPGAIGPAGAQGDIGMPGPAGKPGAIGPAGKDGSPDTPEQILAKLEKVKIPIDIIEGLKNILNALNRNIAELKGRKLQAGGGGGGMSEPQHEQFTCNGVLTQFTLGYKVAYGKAIIGFYQGQQISLTTHFTVSDNVVTLTFTPATGTVVEFIYWRKS